MGVRAPAPPLLEATRLGARVEGRWLWRGLALRLAAGQQLALKGPSGAGKTVLLRILAGLEPPAEGQVCLAGEPQERWAMPAYRARVTYLHQRPALFAGSVEDNLRRVYALRQHREARYDPERVRALLAALGRGEAFLEQDAERLSGGEAQLVALVRALQLEPQVLLLDEATASLDPTTTRRAEAVVADWLAGEGARAAIWTSHDPAQLERLADAELSLGAPHRAAV